MLPPLDRNWTWKAWQDAQTDADPWKEPHTPDEVAVAVCRGAALGFKYWAMQEILRVPWQVIKKLVDERHGSVEGYKELRTLYIDVYTIENKFDSSIDDTRPKWEIVPLNEYREAVTRVLRLLKSIPEIAPPEVVLEIRRGHEIWKQDQALVESYMTKLASQRGMASSATSVTDPQDPAGTTDRDFHLISAVLGKTGLSYLANYPPRAGRIRPTIQMHVEQYLRAHSSLATLLEPGVEINSEVELPPPEDTFTAPPGPRTKQTERRRQSFLSIDRASMDASNRALGEAGERFVIAVERRRLLLEGRPDLAERIEWTAQEVGDGAGFDVKSFNQDGSLRLIEVKTTNGDARTAFYVTDNEVQMSAKRASEYCLYRVYNFGEKGCAIYVLQGSLDAARIVLQPKLYRATPC